MTSNLQQTGPHSNREARITFVSGILALAAVCVGIVPIPFTGYVCFPAAIALAAVAGVYGIRALRQFRALNGNDRVMSAAGLIAGAASLTMTAVSAVLVVALGLRVVEALSQFVR